MGKSPTEYRDTRKEREDDGKNVRTEKNNKRKKMVTMPRQRLSLQQFSIFSILKYTDDSLKCLKGSKKILELKQNITRVKY